MRRCPVCGTWFRGAGPIGYPHHGRLLPVCRNVDCQAFAGQRAQQPAAPVPGAGELVTLDVLRADLGGPVPAARFTSEGGIVAG